MDSKQLALIATPLVIWILVFMFVLNMDRKLARLEAGEEKDDL